VLDSVTGGDQIVAEHARGVMHGAESARPIRVLIVDDHDLFRAGLASLLAALPDIEVTAQCSSGRAGIRLARELRPDVVLMDMRMPDVAGHEATRTILEEAPDMRVVAFTVVSDSSTVAAAMNAGACGFVAKDTAIDDVAAAIRAAAQGAAWLSPAAADVVLGRIRNCRAIPTGPQSEGLEDLSPRELDVLRLLAQGMENSEIAETLHISHRTAKNHVSSILAKLGLPSRVQAAIFAVRRGLE
jgi:DNA-binding NarL/FixJ family response regulator